MGKDLGGSEGQEFAVKCLIIAQICLVFKSTSEVAFQSKKFKDHVVMIPFYVFSLFHGGFLVTPMKVSCK